MEEKRITVAKFSQNLPILLRRDPENASAEAAIRENSATSADPIRYVFTAAATMTDLGHASATTDGWALAVTCLTVADCMASPTTSTLGELLWQCLGSECQ